MGRKEIIDQYHFWLTGLVCDDHHQREYQNLLDCLDSIDFIWSVSNDKNRAVDGINLRSKFIDEYHLDFKRTIAILDRPCSVLEMMVGLACRCEDSIMGDDRLGDRTDQWFWTMIESMKIYIMDDERYDDEYVRDVIYKMLQRMYKRNGEGGLFTVHGTTRDLRRIEIWYQMNWYLDTLDDY